MFVFRVVALMIVVTGISFSEDQIPGNFRASSIEVPDHPSIEAYAEKFSSSRWRPWLESVIKRGSFYALHIIEQLESRRLPRELLYLPVIESEYFNNAISPAGAVGLWQLMEGTAKFYGLVIDDVIDERQDFWKATHVALSILESNYKEFGDWYLAFAAYNGGEGRLREHIKYGRELGYGDPPYEFWDLVPNKSHRGSGLPKETRLYVPKILAMIFISKNPETVHEAGISVRGRIVSSCSSGSICCIASIDFDDCRTGAYTKSAKIEFSILANSPGFAFDPHRSVDAAPPVVQRQQIIHFSMS